MKKEVDLHIHSYYSDGTDAPIDIVERAGKLGLKVISLTDHDTCQGHQDFIQKANDFGVEAVPGVEISTKYKKTHIHILGYNINSDHSSDLERSLMTNQRIHTQVAIIAIKRAGLDELLGVKAEDLIPKIRRAIGRNSNLPMFPVHVKDYIVRDPDLLESLRSGPSQKTRTGSQEMVETEFVSPFDAIKWINDLGGVAVLAHPGNIIKQLNKHYSNGLDEFLWILNKFKKNKLAGIEAIYPNLGPKQEEMFKKLAVAKDLIITGGSDHHGRYRPLIRLGEEGISYSQFLNFKKSL